MEEKELREAGLKVTAPRLRILKLLEGAGQHHLSAEDVYKRLLEDQVDVGLATVYRVLTQFEAAGLVQRHNFESGHSVFEINQGQHHDHLVCEKCGHVEEFFDEVIENRQHQIAEQAGYKVSNHSHTIYGVCANCKG